MKVEKSLNGGILWTMPSLSSKNLGLRNVKDLIDLKQAVKAVTSKEKIHLNLTEDTVMIGEFWYLDFNIGSKVD